MTYDVVSERRAPPIKITGPSDLFQAVRRYANKTQEHFLVITLDTAQQVIKVHLVSMGILNRTLIHPREVFVRAIKDNAAAIIACHNHPSGQLQPSPEDRDVTQRLKQAGELIGIPLLDHLVISKAGFVSLKDLGMFSSNM